MRKEKYKCRYDDKTGMTLYGACIVYCISLAVILQSVLAESISATVEGGFIMAAAFLIVFDLIIRILHFCSRRSNERMAAEDEKLRYISPAEKVTYWTLKIPLPICTAILLLVALIYGL